MPRFFPTFDIAEQWDFDLRIGERVALAIASVSAMGNCLALHELEKTSMGRIPWRGILIGALFFAAEVAVFSAAKWRSRHSGRERLRLGAALFLANLPMAGCLFLAGVFHLLNWEPLVTLRMLLGLLGVFWLFRWVSALATLFSIVLFLRAAWIAGQLSK